MNNRTMMKLQFGNHDQVQHLQRIAKPELVTDEEDRHNSKTYYNFHWPAILYRKNFNAENIKWTCPVCNVDNFVRVHIQSTKFYQPIITPRIYSCHNSRCIVRRFYWRQDDNDLYARYVGKYEEINELDFTSPFDPIKFYANLKPFVDPKQTQLF